MPKKTIRETDILCDYCGKNKFVVEEPGSETPRWLRCHNCDQYYYVTHGILCGNIATSSRYINKEIVKRELRL